MTSKTVLVSGASGFIALHIVQELIKNGYTVVGSVRSEEKGEFVTKNSGDPEKFTYFVVPDIVKEGAFDELVKKHPEASVFLHTASPFHFEATDIEKDLLLPAINGTKNVLASIQAHGPNIKRVVVTSSQAAIASSAYDNDPTKVYDETSWNDITREQALSNPFSGYFGSKPFAERAAWDFFKDNNPGFVLSTVNPVAVLGPQAQKTFDTAKLNTSSEIVNSILKLKTPEDKPFPLNILGVDVRDVAKAHLVAFEKDEAKNERLLLSSGKFTSKTVLDVLHAHFPEQTKNVTPGEPGSDKEEIKKTPSVNNEKTRKILGFPLISIEQSIVDSAKQILEIEGKLK